MKRSVLLTKKEVRAFTKEFTGWTLNKRATEIQRVYAVEKYIDGLVLIARIAVHAEVLGHHPVIEFTFGRVKVKLSTHDLGGLTKLDVLLAERIERIAQGVAS